MRVRIYGQPWMHRLDRLSVADPRLAYTRCGLRFAWGSVPGHHDPLPECPVCAA